MKKKLDFILFTLSGLLLSPFASMAYHPVHLAPLDGGLSFLAAAGVGYGVKKYRDVRKSTRKK